MKRILLPALASAFLALCASAHAGDYQTVEGTYRYGFAQDVLEEVNIERTGRGLAPLVMAPELVDAAMKRAAETSVLWSHTRPNGSRCMTAWSWTGCAGENIAYGQDEPWIVMEDWMESPGHRANILDPDYKSIGVGCFDFGGTLYWVQAFSGGTGSRDTRTGDRYVTVDVGVVSGRDSIVRDYAIAFDANGGTGKASVLQAFYGQSVSLPSAPFARKGFLFLGWATAKNGAVRYTNGATVKNLSTNGGTTTLYAQWAKKSYKVKFCHTYKDETGTMAAQSMTYGKSSRLRANKFKKKGYVFKGWATSKSNARKGKVKFKNKKSVKNLVTNGKTVKLYAVWKKK